MLSLIAAPAFLLTSLVAPIQQMDTTPLLIASGSAEVRTAPDLATLSIGISVQSKTAQDAQNEANAKMADYIAKAKQMLGSKGTVQTGSINLSPVYSEPQMNSGQPFTPQIIGYRADDTLSVRITDFTLVGPAIDAAVASGLNNIQGLSFGLQDDTNAKMQALSDAVKEARKKADVMATAAGLRVLSIRMISEGGSRVIGYDAAPAMMARGGVSTPVEVGDVTTSGDVTVTFVIGQ